ncbi:hypothetical protein MHY85_09830 [Cellulomonas sp. ACRRI]|uniref:hypothetical protein n=1 Tax=Cellulomonas sp. ACRRI TaxID=2918188 RepID=UPI001EF29427|nr:hypothetical protein [Cellulomonas sp. ACRRI]MCG7286268.1 hypothetical protein [Cellulomonas sp. ACRRI]
MRLRRTVVAAEVPSGFHAAEARALQVALTQVLTGVERAAGRAVPVDVVLEAGRDGAVVVVCRNRVVGFVPAPHAGGLRAQVDRAGRRAHVVAPGTVVRDDGLWRVWVGPEPTGGVPPVPDGLDTLPEPQPTILGVPLRRDGS